MELLDETVTPLVELIEGEDEQAVACVDPTKSLKTVCGAKTKGGDPCQRPPMVGRTRCKLHGGASLRGVESGRFKHGLYSKAMPKNLRKTFNDLMSDPDLLDGRAEVALLQIRLTQLTGRLDTSESGAAWLRLQEVFGQFRSANDAADEAGQLAALNTLNEIITGQVNNEAAWHEVTDYTERATRIAEREWKRVIANRNVATAEQVRLIVASLTQAVLMYVTDTKARQQIADHVNRLRVIEPVSIGSADTT
jgi:hypothetical protein